MKQLKLIEDLCLMDDEFMTVVFSNNVPVTQEALRTILDRDDLCVDSVETQKPLMSFGHRAVCLDVYATDSNGKVYNIEIQRYDTGYISKRARFYASMIDSQILEHSKKFSQIPDVYVIFIAENDIIGNGCPIYHIERTISETGNHFNDGSHIIYLNGSYKDLSTPIGQLIHDLHCVNAEDMFSETLAADVRRFKTTEGGKEIMGRAMEKLLDEQQVENIIALMKNVGWTFDEAVEKLNVPDEKRSQYKNMLPTE